MLGRIEFPNEELDDLVLVRSDGRPTYNFANPVEDADDAITHVIRGSDHISNTPKQLQILAALGHELPVYAHVLDVLGDDGRKLSKRHGATSVDELRRGLPARGADELLSRCSLGAGRRDNDHVAGRARRALLLDRVGASPATLDYAKLDWMNGVSSAPPGRYTERLVEWVNGQGLDWPEEVRAAAPLVQGNHPAA